MGSRNEFGDRPSGSPAAPRVDEHGLVTFPAAVRQQIGVEPGDEVAFLETDSGYELPPSSVGERFEQCHGALDPDATMAERTAELRNWPLSETRDDADEQ